MAESGVNWLKFPELDEAGDTSINKKTMRKGVRDKMFSCKGMSKLPACCRAPCLPDRSFLEAKACVTLLSSQICEHRLRVSSFPAQSPLGWSWLLLPGRIVRTGSGERAQCNISSQ